MTTIKCSECKKPVRNCGDTAVSVICSTCVQEALTGRRMIKIMTTPAKLRKKKKKLKKVVKKKTTAPRTTRKKRLMKKKVVRKTSVKRKKKS